MEKITNRTKDLLIIWMFLFMGLLISKTTMAQSQRVDKEGINQLKDWVGTWEGEGWQMDDQMAKQTLQFTEVVDIKLGGLAMTLEAKGMNKEGKVGYHGLGVLVYDMDQKAYSLQSISQDGYAMRSEGQFEDGAFIWNTEVPHGKLRYKIEVKDGKWHETGEYSQDGKTWWPFMELTLTPKNE